MYTMSDKIGLPPGTLVYTGKKKKGPIKIRVIDYTEKTHHDTYISRVEDLKKYVNRKSVTWINVIGVQNTEIIEKIGRLFSIDSLILEDIVNVHSRPKLDTRNKFIFSQLSMIYKNPRKSLVLEQVSILLSNHFVLTFQEHDEDVFDPIRERIKSSHWRIRKLDNDYLAYALIDAIVDNYFLIMEGIGEEVDKLDNAVVKNSASVSIREIHSIKRKLVYMRKKVWPVREIVSSLKKVDVLVKDSTHRYLDDLYDHTVQVLDSIETYREISSSILETYLSTVSNRMNEVMKVLTVISTIFIPLTFITGIYGMNFTNMPEIDWKYGYMTVWFVIAFIAAMMVMYFRRKKWF